ncbi:helix-turn-helix domain-containing protein [Carnobacterium maltaromaticum]|uniref:Helix-turn-helix domain-containing protein n=1 Tax=Carnobacterium maltaromaticum TaxID=2751 RepID=A0AAW9K1B2_CARML|nr:helix-turn-helix domain-containing protein [Carnobacterium maltaromaticum]MDZ5759660.1 helix-turn-helix domain-containing protein [Carnobacterium maltaromaticum]
MQLEFSNELPSGVTGGKFIENRYKKLKMACAYSGVSLSTFQRWVNKGEIKKIRIDGSTLYDKKEIDEFMNKNKLC